MSIFTISCVLDTSSDPPLHNYKQFHPLSQRQTISSVILSFLLSNHNFQLFYHIFPPYQLPTDYSSRSLTSHPFFSKLKPPIILYPFTNKHKNYTVDPNPCRDFYPSEVFPPFQLNF